MGMGGWLIDGTDREASILVHWKKEIKLSSLSPHIHTDTRLITVKMLSGGKCVPAPTWALKRKQLHH